MPPENWKFIIDRSNERDKKLREEWGDGEIIGVGEDVDPFVREQLREEIPDPEPTPDTKKAGERR